MINDIKRVALLDAGAQLEKVIMRRVLEQGYLVDKFSVDVSACQIHDYDAIIISGGPRSVNDPCALLPDPQIYQTGKPILGICYGLQAICYQLGGSVVRGVRGQYGRNVVDVIKREDIFFDLSQNERVLMSHFDSVGRIPDGFTIYGMSEGITAAIGNREKRIYATQFHPELIPVTKNGDKIFENFFKIICRFPEGEKRTIEQELEYARKLIRESAGTNKHIMHYLSGGVDSTIMAILLSQCIEPDRLFMRTLDTGTMRLGEIEEVRKMADELGFKNFSVLDVRDRFYNSMREVQTRNGKVLVGPLAYTTDPELKRKLFGTEYAVIALTEMAHIANEHGIKFEDFLLGQGTLRPDIIESGDKRVSKGDAHTIKTHHNAVDALRNIPKLEPLIELFKDQVRMIALGLGLGEKFAFRQPFPGPGLYCRIIGSHDNEVDEDFLKLDERVRSEGEKYGFNVHALPVRTVGVQGDERSYKHPVIVTGDFYWKDFARFSLELPNVVRGVNRVLYSPGKKLSLEECVTLTKTMMTHDSIMQTQECDSVMREIAEQYGFNDSRRCSQMPGILIPNDFGVVGNRSFVIRPCYTHDFMAIIGMMPSYINPDPIPEEHIPEEMFLQMAQEIPRKVSGISRVIGDFSDKPPASTEWE